MRVIEVEDEHAEARYVAAEIAALVEEGYSGAEIAVFYRMNAQSRVLEDILVRQGVAYQVIGGPRFYERAEVKDLVAYLQVHRQPVRRGLASARREPAASRHRRFVARAPADVGGSARDLAVGGDRRGGRWPVSAPRRRRRSRRSARRSSRS